MVQAFWFRQLPDHDSNDHMGFSNIRTEPIFDLTSYNSKDMLKIDRVTINDETKWTEAGNSKQYHVNDVVIIYYHDAMPDAEADAPEGNATKFVGMTIDAVVARFEEAGYPDSA